MLLPIYNDGHPRNLAYANCGNLHTGVRLIMILRSVEEAVLAHLDKILASTEFARSERLSRFLRFTVEQALEGRVDQLKEYVVGVEVFDRQPSYDPRIDPIVRVEARRLRSKLQKYYESEGRDDELWIELPKGSYVPVFQAAGERLSEWQPSASVGRETIAVLPFTNVSSDQENEYFSDGLTEELIHALTKLERLRVVATTSVLQLKGKAYDIRQIGKQLNVRFVLEGSVRKSGNHLRITAQLIQAADGYYLWSEAYDREIQDLFAIQDEISRAIVTTLRIQLGGGCNPPVLSRRRENLEAYNLYLKGRFHFNKRTEEGLNRSVEIFEQAIALDAGYAPPYAGCADSYALLAHYGILHPRDVMGKARTNALKALEIDPTLAEAYTPLAFVTSVHDWKWPEAEGYYKKSLHFNPGYAAAHHWYAYDLLAPLGRLEEAWDHIQRAVELDPLSFITLNSLTGILIMKGEYDRAIQECRNMLEMEPNFYKPYMHLGRAYVQKEMYGEALEMFQMAKTLCRDIPYVTAVLSHTHALAGHLAEARRLMHELLELSKRRYVPSTSFALMAIGLGEMEQAFDWLEKAADEREGPLVYLKVHPSYACLRTFPRFHALLRRLGLGPLT